MMMTAIAISPMMRNVLSVATILPTAVKASDMARIAPRIVPMIRRMSPVCAGAWLQDGASSDELAGLRQNVPDRLSRSLAGPSAAGTAAPSPRRGGQGELHKSRSCRAPHTSPPGNGWHRRWHPQGRTASEVTARLQGPSALYLDHLLKLTICATVVSARHS